MATFTYQGEDRDGNPVSETVTAGDRFAVYAIARQNGHTVSSIKEAGGLSLGGSFNMERINSFLSRV